MMVIDLLRCSDWNLWYESIYLPMVVRGRLGRVVRAHLSSTLFMSNVGIQQILYMNVTRHDRNFKDIVSIKLYSIRLSFFAFVNEQRAL